MAQAQTQAPRQLVLQRLNRIKFFGFLGIVFIIFIIILTVENLLVSSLFAFVISYLFGPWVSYLEREGLNRVLGTSATFVFVGAVLGYAGYELFPYLGDYVSGLQHEIPKYIDGLGELISKTESHLQDIAGPMYQFNLRDQVQNSLTTWSQDFFSQLPNYLKKFTTTLLLAPFIAFFMVKDGRQILRTMLALVPNNLFEAILSLQSQINLQIGQFVRARLLEALIVGFVTWLGLVIIGFPFAIPLALFAAVTNLIPYIGPIIGLVPAVLIALVNDASSFNLFLLLLVYFIAQLIDAAFIIPLVVAKIVDLHPVTVIVVIIIGSQLMGVIGMLISIPVASALKVTMGTVYRHLTDYRA